MAQQKRVITILSIDGGGIRGIIPATILSMLEKHLQDIDGKDARISDYFDVIAGTSTGSLLAAMLVAPKTGYARPRTASEIIDFYNTAGSQIFSVKSEKAYQAGEELGGPPKGCCCCITRRLFHCARKNITKGVTKFIDPIYDRKHLDKTVHELLGQLRLSEVPKSIIIPAFDLKAKSPVVFSNKQSVKRHPNITLANVVISSSSAPYYFPSHRFIGEKEEHELIDGGIAANNPVLLAIGEAKKEFPKLSESVECYRILSLGTGTVHGKNMPNFMMGRGGIFDLLVSSGGSPPILEMMFRANEVMADMYTSTMLGNFNQYPHYLRIQEYDLDKDLNSMNNATPINLNALQMVARKLLDKHVTVADSFTGLQEEIKGPDAPASNGDALARFAEMLAKEKKASASMSS